MADRAKKVRPHSREAFMYAGKLTSKQKMFCHAYVYLTGLDGYKAVEIAGYNFNSTDKNPWQAKANRNDFVRKLLSNTNVIKYITALRKELNNQLLVDKLYIMEKLKGLSEVGENDSIKLKALIEMGKLQGLYEDKVKLETTAEDPSKIIQDAFKARKEGKYLQFDKKEEAEIEEEVDKELGEQYGDEDEQIFG